MKHLKHILLLIPALIVSLVIMGGFPVYANTYLEDTDDQDITVTENNSYTIIDGVTEGDLTLNKSGGGTVKAHVVLVKANAHAKFRAITPGYYTAGSTAATRAATAAAWTDDSWSWLGVTDMVAQYNSAGDTSSHPVLAAINGDFGGAAALNQTGKAPRGSLILEGNGEMAHKNAFPDEFFFGYRNDGSVNIVGRTTNQKDTFTEAICGGAWILRNGDVEESLSGDSATAARTGLAIKPNGDTMMITVENGITVEQLAKLMKSSGCCNGINMDGGGSVTMLTKRSGGQLTRKTPDFAGYTSEPADSNKERKVGTALMLVSDSGVANTASASGTTVTTDKDTYEIGEPIYVTASSDKVGAWVGMWKKDDPLSSGSYYWYYTYGCEAGTWCWNNGERNNLYSEGVHQQNPEAGEYKLVVVDAARNPLATKYITLTPPEDDPSVTYSLELDKSVYEVGEDIQFKAAAPTAHTWVGIFKSDDIIPGDYPSYYWYDLWKYDQNIWHVLNKAGGQVSAHQRPGHTIGAVIAEGEYKVILFGAYDGDDTYTQKVAKDIIIYDPDAEYSIAYMNGDKSISGLTPAKYSYSPDTSVSLPSKSEVENAVEGHTFYGWYTNSELTGDAVTEIPKGSMGARTFYAKLQANTYTVEFDTDGGTVINPKTVTYGEKIDPPQDPEKEEKVFLGWVTTKNGTKEFDFNQPITGNTTIYASWGDKGYIVTFDTCGGSTINKQTVKAGEKARQPANPKRAGYRFAGWVTTAGGSTSFDFDTPITEDITIYASWRLLNYSITYDLNGGTAGESQNNPTTYNVESPTITLKSPSREGFTFAGWKDEEGNIVETIEQGSTGNLVLTAQWKQETSLKTDKDEYVEGQAIKVTAYCETPGSWVGLYKVGDVPGTSDLAYYWSWVTDSEGNPVISGQEVNLLNYKHEENSKPFAPGTYHIILFGDSGYTELLRKTITIKENTDNPLQGSIEISGFTRDDKTYSGSASSESGRTLYEYFYGDDIRVKAAVSGLGAEDAWVGIISDDDFSSGYAGSTVSGHWYWTEDYKGQSVSLNYMIKNEIAEDNSLLPFGLNYWVVLVSGSGKIIDAEPFNFRTYNVDWNNVTWGENAKQNIRIDLEWISKLATGENLRPEITITRINGLFGYEKDGEGKFKKDDNGNLIPITEEELEQNRDYEVTYPSESKNPDSYTIKVTFPSKQPIGDDGKEQNNYYKYLSTNSGNYGLKDGVKYYLTEEAGQHAIQYVLNGGTNNSENPSFYKKGEEVILLAPSKAGNIFEGWYTTADFLDGSLIETIPADSDDDIIVYAKWTSEESAAYKITYVLNGGTNNAKNPDGYTGNVDLSIKPAKKPGYTFDGWFFDKDFTQSADVIPKGTSGDITLYAKFTKTDGTTFRISTYVTGGSISNDANVKKGSSHTVTYEPNVGWILQSIIVDGEEVDIDAYPTSYTFGDVSEAHTIKVVYSKISSGSSSTAANTAAKVANGMICSVESQTYQVSSVASSSTVGTVIFTKAKNAKKVKVPATVQLADGKTYLVTGIAANAFTGGKIRTVTVGPNVSIIYSGAFRASKAKNVIVKTKLLKKITVKGSLKGSKVKKISVKVGAKKVNKTYAKKYKKIFTKKNAGRKASVK